MGRDTAPTSYVFDLDPHSRHLTTQIFLSSDAFASAFFLAQIVSDRVLICDFQLQRPYPWNIISPSGERKWTLVDANRRALASSRVKTSTVSASDEWAWPMHEMLFLAFLTANTAIILLKKPC